MPASLTNCCIGKQEAAVYTVSWPAGAVGYL